MQATIKKYTRQYPHLKPLADAGDTKAFAANALMLAPPPDCTVAEVLRLVQSYGAATSGSAKSSAKSAAARFNGAKGGRPKKADQSSPDKK